MRLRAKGKSVAWPVAAAAAAAFSLLAIYSTVEGGGSCLVSDSSQEFKSARFSSEVECVHDAGALGAAIRFESMCFVGRRPHLILVISLELRLISSLRSRGLFSLQVERAKMKGFLLVFWQ